jgi:transposase
MHEVMTIGLDIAKQFFQVHGIDRAGQVIVQKTLSRKDVVEWFTKFRPCLVGIESCATSTYWAREIGKLGHTVKLIPPAYVKPYVRRQKNDRNDAAAICEAVTRPSMRFVAIKTEDQQAIQMLHRTRDLLVAQQTQSINALRAHLAEFGYTFPKGNVGVTHAILAVKEEAEARDLPVFARQVLQSLVNRLDGLRQDLKALDVKMREWHRTNADSKRLTGIPGVGVVIATSVIAAIGDGTQFRNGREFAAWVGLVPRQNSSGGKDKLAGISKRGNAQLRSLLVVGATSMLSGRLLDKAPGGVWFRQILSRKKPRLATVALANKMARVAWAMLVKGTQYQASYHPLLKGGNQLATAAA